MNAVHSDCDLASLPAGKDDDAYKHQAQIHSIANWDRLLTMQLASILLW